MLSPEVWDFPAPASCTSYSKTSLESVLKPGEIIKEHYFNHAVCLMVPNTMQVPLEVKEEFERDGQFYKIVGVSPADFLEAEFVKSFVKAGEVTAVAIDRCLDLDDCFALTPSGSLVVSVQEEIFHRLGIEKGPAISVDHKVDDFTQICFNLKKDCFVPGKNNYERARKQLQSLAEDLKMDVLLSWEPSDIKVCPSSVAAYFDSLGFVVEECLPKYEEVREYNLVMPPLSYDPDLLFEWFGATLLGIKGASDDPTETYLSTYTDPDEGEEIGQAVVLKWFGLFTANRICRLFESLKDIVKEELWVGMHVQGFEDSPVSWGLERHHYHSCGENNYSLLLEHSGHVVAAKTYTKPSKKKSKK